MADTRTLISIPIPPWYSDHHFGGRVILAAVEAMQLLAFAAHSAHPGVDVRTMTDGRFAKLLELPAGASSIDALVETEDGENETIRTRLLTRTQGKVMTRLVSNCEVHFAATPVAALQMDLLPAAPAAESSVSIDAARIYDELVPFGPSFRSLQDRLYLSAEVAWGRLQAAALGNRATQPLGSPFPLDGAMHAACVHGQRLVDFVPFPVGFASRHVFRPTQAGERYQTQAQLKQWREGELIYDLSLVDEAGHLRETVKGLLMRDVSQGLIKPPAWVKTLAPGGQTALNG
jgi:hypothetical protein